MCALSGRPTNTAIVSAAKKAFAIALWYLGFAQARVKAVNAWSRLFALFAIALLVLTTLGMALLIRGGPDALRLLRRVASRAVIGVN